MATNPLSGDRAPRSDTGTRSYEQPHRAKSEHAFPNRPSEKMPHERDESAQPTGKRQDDAVPASDPQISQAGEDIKNGLIDTERRGTPNNVPGGER